MARVIRSQWIGLPAFFTIACAASDDGGPKAPTTGSEGTVVDGDTDDGVDIDAEAPVDDSIFGDISAEVTTIPTVVRVTWTTTEAVSSYVTFVGEDSAIQRATDPDPASTEHEAFLVGLISKEEVALRVYAETDQGWACSSVEHIETGAISSALPEITLSNYDPERTDSGFTAVAILTERTGYGVLLDELGRYVWVTEISNTTRRIKIGRDGKSVLYNEDAAAMDMPGSIVRMGLDGEVIEEIEMLGIHTDFDELKDGAVAALGWRIHTLVDDEGDTRKILGDTVEVSAAGGPQRSIWNVFDHFDPILDVEYDNTWYQGEEDVEDWSHVNGISYDLPSGAVLVSMSPFGGLSSIDAQSGTVNWFLSTKLGEYVDQADIVAPAYAVAAPHSVHTVDADTVMVFNRRTYGSAGCSGANLIELNEVVGTAESDWDYQSESCMVVPYLGEARPLPNGNALVTFTTSGQMDQATPEGETVWQVNTELGAAFGFGDFVEDL